MIFDYILKNRFYAPDVVENVDPFVPSGESSNEPPNPYADIIPKAPHNRLETFLNMIVGEFKGMAAADPIKPISEMEYWLNEIAAAKDGNPWRDTTGKFVAKRIGVTVNESNSFTFYSLTIDTGLTEFPYARFKLEGEANGCEIFANPMSADDITPLDKEIANGDMLDQSRVATAGTSLEGTETEGVEVFPGDPGLLLAKSPVLFIKNGDDTIKMQVLMVFVYNDLDHALYNNEAEELILDTFDLKFVEDDKS